MPITNAITNKNNKNSWYVGSVSLRFICITKFLISLTSASVKISLNRSWNIVNRSITFAIFLAFILSRRCSLNNSKSSRVTIFIDCSNLIKSWSKYVTWTSAIIELKFVDVYFCGLTDSTNLTFSSYEKLIEIKLRKMNENSSNVLHHWIEFRKTYGFLFTQDADDQNIFPNYFFFFFISHSSEMIKVCVCVFWNWVSFEINEMYANANQSWMQQMSCKIILKTKYKIHWTHPLPLSWLNST